MNTQTNFYAPIMKHEVLDDGRMMIEGVATSTAVDKQGDVIDYTAAKSAFSSWSGNIREMHDPKKAVGKAVDVTYLDDAEQIVVKAYISAGAKDTQAKVADGTLSMFSIGGQSNGQPVTEKVAKSDGSEIEVKRVFMARISEVSVVDSGANPDSGFAIVKADGALGDEIDAGEVAGEVEETIVEPEPEQKSDKYADIKKYAGSEVWDASRAIEALNIITGLLFSEISEQEQEPEQIAALQASIDGLKAFIVAEIQEDNGEKADIFGDIQKSIDALSALLPVADVQKADGENDIQKMYDEATAKNAALQAELDTLKAQPAPAKVTVRVVPEKENDDTIQKRNIIEQEVDRIEKLADPEEKAREMIKLQHKYGAVR